MVETTQKQIVLITGVQKFLSLHIALQFVKDGTYSVRLGDKFSNDQKVEQVRAALGDNNEVLFVEFKDEISMKNAIKDVSYIVHGIQKAPKTENDVMRVINELKFLLDIAVLSKVKRFVFTSSVASIFYNNRLRNDTQNLKCDEFDWSDVDHPLIANAAKYETMIEKVIWSYYSQIEVVIINTGFMLGPSMLNKKRGGAALKIIEALISSKFPGLPKVTLPLVDVRDCALAHLNALKIEQAANNRFIIVKESLWLTEIAQILSQQFKEKKIVTRELYKWMAHLGAYIVPDLTDWNKLWAVQIMFENQKSRQVLMIEYKKTLPELIIEIAEQIEK